MVGKFERRFMQLKRSEAQDESFFLKETLEDDWTGSGIDWLSEELELEYSGI